MVDYNRLMKAFSIIPPLVQLNAPYPSGAYLTAFFKSQGLKACQADFSLELFYEIFCRKGVEKLFNLSEKKALEMADRAEEKGDENTAFNLRRYISTKTNWIEWIDFITAVLSGKTAREKEHQFLYSPFVPRGHRMDSYLEQLAQEGREPSVDDVRFLCSYALADLADYITAVFDSEFSLIRYAEALTVDERSFSDIEKALDSPVLKSFYEPLLGRLLSKHFKDIKDDELTLVCISIPFAGTFLPALFTARYLKEKYGSRLFICIGGGFVNTELREACEKSLSKYIDAISYDRGYGSYKALFDSSLLEKDACNRKSFCSALYKMRLFFDEKSIAPLWKSEKYEAFEADITRMLVPDYSDIDFSRYLRMCDDKNAMHRIWTDGSWIKAYLAHGCYWHKCAFCDTQLDYVCGYKLTDVEKLYEALLKTAREKGVYGIHFVDEALPPAAIKKFALLNARAGNPLYFWGNVRFEKSFSKDLAAFLSFCGLGAVSAGIESATGSGLENINKGTDIRSITHACCAFKEAGILVHAYMIYGFWNDTAQSIIDSMETLRQFFTAGLLDSAFWHKFVLTKNSTVYAQWKAEGKLDMVCESQASSVFAKNNLHFKGEEKFNRYGAALDAAVNAWMHGHKLGQKVQKWFDFQLPAPCVKATYIEDLIADYEKKNSRPLVKDVFEKTDENNGLFWLGGNPIVSSQKSKTGKKLEIRWIYLLEEYSFPCDNLPKNFSAEKIISILNNLSPSAKPSLRTETINHLKQYKELQGFISALHNKGVVYV